MKEQLIVRPDVAELSFQLFDRSVHPELFESLVTRTFERDGFRLSYTLTPAGHVFQWRRGSKVITEALVDQSEPLPEHGQLFAHRVGGERNESIPILDGATYQTCFQMERLPAELFLHVQNELRQDSERDGMSVVLPSADRLGLSPLSYADLQARPGSLIIHSYHTYPDQNAIVKIQSLIEFTSR